MGERFPGERAWRGLDEPGQTLRARFRRSGRGRGREDEDALVPAGQRTDWCTRLTAEKRGFIANRHRGESSVASGLQPHLVAHFSFSKDPQFVREGAGHWDLLAVDPGTTLLYSEPFPLVRWSWLTDGILRNFGARWDQDLRLTCRLGPTLELLLL